MDWSTWMLVGVGLLLFWIGLRVWTQPCIPDAAWKWHLSIPGLPIASAQFYGQIQTALQGGVELREVPLKGMGFGPSGLFETRSLLAERQTYLEARYKDVRFYLYAAETPTGFFVSEWLFTKYLAWLRYPILCIFARRYFATQTLFQHDAVLMIGEAMHQIVVSTLDEMMEPAKLPPLEDNQCRPVMHAFYGGSVGTSAPARRKQLPL